MLMGNITVYVFQHNHLDPLWQRCWDRTFDYRGTRYRSYADVQEHVINLWLANARRGTTFTEGQSVVIRKYLDRNPDRLDEVRRLVECGQIELMASGEIVCDTNMPSGETLLRNLILGQRYFEDTFGVIPTIASLEDAFGHSAQMPQLLRGVECTLVTRLSRKRVPGDYWRGLDGSVIAKGRLPSGRYVGHWQKIPPCPECSGMGCEKCGGRGLADAAGLADEDIWRELTTDWGDVPFGVLGLGGEEAVPNLGLPDMVERARSELGMDVRMGILAQMSAHCADIVARIDDPDPEVSDQVEANCVYTGCYVSRISTKQDLRRIENLVNTAERWATVAYLQGLQYPSDDLLAAWRNTVFLAFHDAVTGTQLDQPYYELRDMLADAQCRAERVIDESLSHIERRITIAEDKHYLVVHNSCNWVRSDPVTVTIAGANGVPRLISPSGDEIEVLDVTAEGTDLTVAFRPSAPALGYTALEIVPDSAPIDSGVISTGPGEVENEFFRVRVGGKGIESILDRRTGQEIAHTGYLVNELLLEEDLGDPWGTMKIPPPAERLGAYTTGAQIRRTGNVSEVIVTGQYKGVDPNVRLLSWRQSMVLYKGYDRIDFRTVIDWDTENRRIRIALPTGLMTDEAVYSIPYGALTRTKYEPEMDVSISANGDWPAVNWIDVYDGSQDYGVALLNTGTPSHKLDDGVVFLSVLRSPAELWSCTAEDYDHCLDFDGARDAGSHEFRYSLVPHQGDYRSAGIEKRGRELNDPLICRGCSGPRTGALELSHSFLRLDATDNVSITAIKKADRDNSVIVRLAETDGVPGEASISIDGAGDRLSLVNFLERDPKPVSGPIPLGPFKILTVRLAGCTGPPQHSD